MGIIPKKNAMKSTLFTESIEIHSPADLASVENMLKVPFIIHDMLSNTKSMTKTCNYVVVTCSPPRI